MREDEFDDTSQLLKLDIPAIPTVLIVDDDDLVLARLRELVVAAGFEVHTASGGADALASLEQSFASIVITDLTMPGMDGLDLCHRIRDHAWPGYIYVVVLTARNEEKDILAGLEAGADDYLSKRTSSAQFIARLKTAKRILALEHSLKNAVEQKRQQAMTDALTGIFNRRYFMRHMSREMKRIQRFGGELTLLLLDVDHFKHVNDSYGHEVGDAVLKGLTRLISNTLRRETDWCARLGGEEFVVILEGTKLAGAHACAEQLRKTIEDTAFDTSAGAIRVTVSIGISGLEGNVGRNSATVESQLKQADTNLYVSKANGRNRVTSPQASGTRANPRHSNVGWSNEIPDKAAVRPIR